MSIYSSMLANVTFGTVAVSVLGVFASIVVVILAIVGVDMIKRAVIGDRVFYGGRFWDRDVYDSAMQSMGRYKRAGGKMDKDTSRRFSDWRSNKAKRDIFG